MGKVIGLIPESQPEVKEQENRPTPKPQKKPTKLEK